jgi:WD40 repeat protein
MKARHLTLALLGLLLAGCEREAPLASSGPRIEARPALVFSDAPGPAREARFSADGNWLATSSSDGTIGIRHVPDWKPLRRLRHPGGATALLFTRDARRLVTAGYDGNVRIWDVATGKSVSILTGAAGTVWTLDLSPDGKVVAAAGEDRIIRLWSIEDGRLVRRLAGHERNIWDVRFSPDGHRLASGSFDRSLRLWDATDGRLLAVRSDHSQAVVGVAWSPDGKWLASGGDDSTIRIRRASDGAPVRTIAAGNHAYKLSFSPDSRWIVSAGRARGGLGTLWHGLTGLGGPVDTTRLWRTADGALVGRLKADDDIASTAFSPDGRWLVTSGEDSKVSLWALSAR